MVRFLVFLVVFVSLCYGDVGSFELEQQKQSGIHLQKSAEISDEPSEISDQSERVDEEELVNAGRMQSQAQEDEDALASAVKTVERIERLQWWAILLISIGATMLLIACVTLILCHCGQAIFGKKHNQKYKPLPTDNEEMYGSTDMPMPQGHIPGVVII